MSVSQKKKKQKAAESGIAEYRRQIWDLKTQLDYLPRLGGHRRYLEVAMDILAGAFEAYRDHLERPQEGSEPEDAPGLRQKILHEAYNEAFVTSGDRSLEDSEVPDDRSGPCTFPGTAFTVPEVLQFLSFNKKCGTVSLEAGTESITIELEDGSVIDARSTNSPPGYRLGEILVQQGVVSDEILNSFIGTGRPAKDLLGHELSDGSIVSEQQLVDGLREQMGHLFRRAIESDGSDISFTPRTGPYEPTDLYVDLMGLLLEGAAFADDKPVSNVDMF